MKLITRIFTFIFFFISYGSNAQHLSLSDLVAFVKKDVPSINEMLLTNDWEYLGTEGDVKDKRSNWAYEMSLDSTANAWLEVQSNPRYLNIVILQFFNSAAYSKFLNSISALGAKKISSEVKDDGRISSRFAGKNYIYELSTLRNRHKLIVYNRDDFLKSILEGLEEAGATLDTITDTN